jgi:hypothetical protein
VDQCWTALLDGAGRQRGRMPKNRDGSGCRGSELGRGGEDALGVSVEWSAFRPPEVPRDSPGKSNSIAAPHVRDVLISG